MFCCDILSLLSAIKYFLTTSDGTAKTERNPDASFGRAQLVYRCAAFGGHKESK